MDGRVYNCVVTGTWTTVEDMVGVGGDGDDGGRVVRRYRADGHLRDWPDRNGAGVKTAQYRNRRLAGGVETPSQD